MRRVIVFFLVAIAVSASCSRRDASLYGIVPRPHVVESLCSAPFDCAGTVSIVVDDNDCRMMKNALFLAGFLEKVSGARPEINGRGKEIVLKYDELAEGEEAYELLIKGDRVVIRGGHAGVFYGIQTLRKAVSANGGVLPAARISDWPAFGYRGAHLDVSRHFFDVDEVKAYLDMMALHNMNVFHWHLTDDQGWRIEIRKYPGLTSKGAVRKRTVSGHLFDEPRVWEEVPYGEGCFYTREQVMDIVAYASDRYIDIVPEIDLPGHMQAALATYPELGCTRGPYEVWPLWGVSDDVLCAGNPRVYGFLDDVFGEIVEMFPFEYIHIGGDECPKVRWEACPKCQAMISDLGLEGDGLSTAENKLQSYMMSHVVGFLKEKGRKAIGWDEVLEGGVSDGLTVMSWRGEDGGIAAAKLGHDVVMTPYTHLYFDYNQCEDYLREPYGKLGYGVVTLEKVYGYNPFPESLDAQGRRHILGLQANLWTEYVRSMEQVQYQVLPRWAALSENQWYGPSDKDYASFLSRLGSLLEIYDMEGYNYSDIAFGDAG